MKHILIVLTFIGVIGGLVFSDQVLAVFHGMTPLESLRMIWTFVLHAAVVTVIGYAGFSLSEIIAPWVKTFRWKQRSARRGRHGQWQSGPNAHWGRAGAEKFSVKELAALLPFLLGNSSTPPEKPRLDLARFRLEEDDPGDLDITV